ncbi:DUF2135 domain-containing protein [Chitinimonas lacunae]|uniref:DUF2135 domain-containing protein n=1 Tax=Chitinimonas lacunae TaxID=1963018 RepID=A0ABV8MRD7_9NEIS
MPRSIFLLPLLAALLTGAPAFAKSPPVLPLIAIDTQLAPQEQPVRVDSLTIAVQAVGSQVETVIDLTLFNPNSRPLEGNLQFPLLPGQQIVGFSLDIGNEMRDAVPVAKERGRQVFEAIERRRVDPGLLEVTEGNFFRLRVYPVLPGQVRKVRLRLAETLPQVEGGYRYALPLDRFQSVERIGMAVTLPAGQKPELSAADGPIQLVRQGQAYMADLKPLAAGKRPLTLRWKAAERPVLLTERVDGEQFFAAEIPLGPLPARQAPPPVIGLLWDSSGSGAKRDLAAELRWLERYLREVKQAEVRLIRLRDRAEKPLSFRIENGNWRALREALERTVYDGASSLDGWTAQADVGEYLLFSDGMVNYGTEGFPTLSKKQRLFAIDSSVGSDRDRLTALTLRHGGSVIALDEGRSEPLPSELPRVVSLTGEGVGRLVFDPSDSARGLLRIAGVQQGQGAAKVRLRLAVSHELREIELPLHVERSSASGQAARLWARYRLAGLGRDAADRAETRAIGRRFGLVTRDTSLLVLENLSDYVQYDIAPPPSLRAQFEQLRAANQASERQQRERQIEQLVQQYQAKIAWWETRYPKDTPPRPKLDHKMARRAGLIAPPAAPAPLAAAAAEPMAEAVADKAEQAAASDGAGIRIALQPWQADSPVLRALQRVRTEQLYPAYLARRAANANSSAFFLDVADLLLARGQRELALRVLSNLAEMELENRHILRILGYRLLQAGEPALAVPVFERVLEMAEEEPQSFRDLGLAYEAAGRYQEAANQWVEVVSRVWDDRFPEIELITLADLNALDARVGPLRINLDPRLRRNLPLDLRAVLTWDADNSDMDLWITDPNGEKCFYGNPLTYQGGRMSRDFVGGYGPEEFSLRHAKPGRYKVEANFYGHQQQIVAGATTLQLKLTTGFGTPAMKEKMVTLRLQGAGKTVFVGEFEVPAKH